MRHLPPWRPVASPSSTSDRHWSGALQPWDFVAVPPEVARAGAAAAAVAAAGVAVGGVAD